MKNELNTLVKTDFLAFARKAIYELDGTEIGHDRYLELLATALLCVVAGDIKRLLINIAPRHLKSRLSAVCLAAWILANQPRRKILIVSYAEELAKDIARSVRSILRSPWFKDTFGTRIAKGHDQVTKFATTAGGEVYAVSANGAVTGFGADLIIVDDPHNISDARHVQQLQETIENFDTVIMSRLNDPKNGRIVVIAHRIHDADLSAHLIATQEWTHILLPAIATRDESYETLWGKWHRQKGTLLRPDAFDLEKLEAMRKKLVNPTFDLLYQQDADGQALPPIGEQNFPPYDPGQLPPMQKVISVDTATGKKDRRSFTVIQVWASDGRKHYLIEQYRERCDFSELEIIVRQFCRRYRHAPILIEETANGPALISKLGKMHRKRIHEITPRGSKTSRFRPHIEAILEGRVYMPRNATLVPGLVKEFVEFPHGRHTDRVDAFTQYMTWIAENESFVHSQPVVDQQMYMAVGQNSEFRGLDPRFMRQDPKAPGVMVVGGYSNRMPNSPFPTIKAWVVR